MTVITPLEAWIAARTGIAGPSAERLAAYQLRCLNHVIAYARDHAPFYRRHLAGVSRTPLPTLADLAAIPFTTATDLAHDPGAFLAVRQDDIARIVTLRSSGSSGEAKRLFFTEDDLELTVDFFHHGMATLVRPGEKVAVLLPGERPDSVGDLLVRGLRRMKVLALAFGPVGDPRQAAADIAAFGPDCLVGIPVQLLAIARTPVGQALGRIKSVLLSTDYVPDAIARSLTEAWNCRVFSHYGMTEMGLGGGVECEARDGYHLRENDLYVEVVDHRTGVPCADGALGEVVFTTLTRRGMPLIRYRTGDIARILTGPCPCGSSLRRMERVRGRWPEVVELGNGSSLTLTEMDERLFRLPGLLDYRVTLTRRADGPLGMLVEVQGVAAEVDLRDALSQVEAIRQAIASGAMDLPELRIAGGGWRPTTGTAKRKILGLN